MSLPDPDPLPWLALQCLLNVLFNLWLWRVRGESSGDSRAGPRGRAR